MGMTIQRLQEYRDAIYWVKDVPCEDVLAQINAAKSALHKAGQVILEGHIHHCVLEGLQNGNVDETIAKFTKTIERFANMG